MKSDVRKHLGYVYQLFLMARAPTKRLLTGSQSLPMGFDDVNARSVAGTSFLHPKGPRTQIIGSWGPNTIILMVSGP